MKFKEISTIGKVAIYLSGIMVVAFAIAFGVFFTPGIIHARGGVEQISDERMNIYEMKETAAGSLSKIIVETSSPDVILQPVSGNTLKAELKGYMYPKKLAEDATPILEMSEHGGIVSFRTEFLNNFSIGIREINLILTVSVPESYSGDLLIRTASGDVELAGLKPGELEVRTASGGVDVRKCMPVSMKIDTASGDIRVDSVKGDSIEAETTSGSIIYDTVSGNFIKADSTSGDFRGEMIEAGQFSRTTASGDTKVRDFSGTYYCKSISGTIETVFTEFVHDIEAGSTSGDVILSLPEVPGFDLHIETTSGDIDCDWPVTMTVDGKIKDNRLIGMIGDGGPDLTVKTTSGDVELIEL